MKFKSEAALQTFGLTTTKGSRPQNGIILMTPRSVRSTESRSAVLVDRQRIEDWLVAQIASMQRIEPEQVDVDDSFIANGLSSSSSVALIGDLAEVLGVRLSETLTWEYPTIAALAEHVAGIGASPHDD